jgi:hypothetical protein
LPPEVSGEPEIFDGGVTPLPAPTWSRTLAGTLVVCEITVDRAAPVGPLLTPEPDFGFEVVLTSTRATTTAMTTTTAPDASSTRLRISARRWAARWAAILSRREASCFVLLALPIV